MVGCRAPGPGNGAGVSPDREGRWKSSPANPRVEITTNLGRVVVELAADAAPRTVLNFTQYAQDGFYDGTIFHRVAKDYLIQGGAYLPSFELADGAVREPIALESDNGLRNVRGTVAMARRDAPHSATTQFYFNLADNGPELDYDASTGKPGYAVFGVVVEGMEVLNRIADVPVGPHEKFAAGQVPCVPRSPVIIESVRVVNPGTLADVEARVAALDEQDAAGEDDVPLTVEEQVTRFIEETGLPFSRTDSGILYADVRLGQGPAPQPGDRVVFHYLGRLLDGRVFENSYERTDPARHELDNLIPGLRDMLLDMRVGGLRIAVIPPELAYAETGVPHGDPPLIPPNATITYQIELLEIR